MANREYLYSGALHGASEIGNKEIVDLTDKP